jgi:hypothetical protein
MQESGTVSFRPALRRIRALKMMEMLIAGRRRAEIAQHFRISPRTVHNEIGYLEREGLLQRTEEAILGDLQPLAVRVMRKHLEEQAESPRPDPKAATAVLREAMKRAAIPRRDTGDSEMTLEKWVIERRARKEPLDA